MRIANNKVTSEPKKIFIDNPKQAANNEDTVPGAIGKRPIGQTNEINLENLIFKLLILII